jgi:3D (Asp-Asp-Asp) domain-containing protein
MIISALLGATVATVIVSLSHIDMGTSNTSALADLQYEIEQLQADNEFLKQRHIEINAELAEAEERANYYEQIAEDAADDAAWWEYAGEVSVSWYAADEPGMSDKTASGKKPIAGLTVALGKSYPFGTEVYIEGIGYRVCHDRGGAITNGHADVFVDNVSDIPAVGRYNADMWVKHTGIKSAEDLK